MDSYGAVVFEGSMQTMLECGDRGSQPVSRLKVLVFVVAYEAGSDTRKGARPHPAASLRVRDGSFCHRRFIT